MRDLERDGGPEQEARGRAGDAEPGEEKGRGNAVGEHAEAGRAGPAGEAEADQRDAGDPRHGGGEARHLGAEQELPDEGGGEEQGGARGDFGDRCDGEGAAAPDQEPGPRSKVSLSILPVNLNGLS